MDELLSALIDMDRDNPAFTETVRRLRAYIAEAAHDQQVLAALERAGVDNWDGYAQAMRDAGDEDES